MKHTSTPQKALLLTAALLLAGCASSSAKRARSEVNEKIDHGDFRAAVADAAAFYREHPNSEDARLLHLRARAAWMLDTGRSLSFEGRDDEALAIFREVQELVPDSLQAQQWVTKTEHKLGTHWNNIGLEYHASDNLPAAMEAYQTALTYLPENDSAIAGLAAARFLSQYRDGVGGGYYTAGVRALSEYYLQQARAAFEKTLKYREQDPQSEMRRDQVKVMLSAQRTHLAASLEEKGLFGAAKNEYKMALSLDPENSEAAIGVERAGREAQAKIMLLAAEMQILRRSFDQARQTLAEGAELTEVQDELFQGAMAGIDDAIYEDMYQSAIDLYKDGDYEGAVVRFDRLLEKSEYYKDARTRRENLQADILAAQERYDLAKTAATDEERLRLLREIEIFWTNYKDIQIQIHRLEGRD